MDETATRELDTQALEQILIGYMMAIAGEADQIFRPVTMFDHGIDGEVEFKDNDGKASGKRIYIQLKSGNSYLRTRKGDGSEVFDVSNDRHLEYWISQPVDVYYHLAIDIITLLDERWPMPIQRRPIDVHRQAAEVIHRESVEKIPWKLQRLQGIRLAMEGQDGYRRIAQIVRTTAATLNKWINWYREGGIEGLLSRPVGSRGGKTPRFTPEEWERFRAQLAKGTWRTAGDAQRWLKGTLGLKISRKEVYRHLGKLDARLKVGRRSHVKKDPAAAEAFKTGGLDAKLAALALPRRTLVRVWVCDEARFGLHTEHRRMWGLRGVRVVVPHQQKYEWDYTYGAVEVTRAGSVFCFQSTVHQEASGKFLEQIVAHDPAAIHVVIQDGAGFHLPENDPRLPANVRIITLPAYSPELNPVEKLWDHMKDEICNRVFASVEELREALTGWLEEFWSDGARALSLIGRGWLLASVNAGAKG